MQDQVAEMRRGGHSARYSVSIDPHLGCLPWLRDEAAARSGGQGSGSGCRLVYKVLGLNAGVGACSMDGDSGGVAGGHPSWLPGLAGRSSG